MYSRQYKSIQVKEYMHKTKYIHMNDMHTNFASKIKTYENTKSHKK